MLAAGFLASWLFQPLSSLSQFYLSLRRISCLLHIYQVELGTLSIPVLYIWPVVNILKKISSYCKCKKRELNHEFEMVKLEKSQSQCWGRFRTPLWHSQTERKLQTFYKINKKETSEGMSVFIAAKPQRLELETTAHCLHHIHNQEENEWVCAASRLT